MHEDFKWLFLVLVVFAAFWFASGSINKLGNKKPFLQPVIQSGDAVVNANFSHIDANSTSWSYATTPNQTYNAGSATKNLTAKEEIAQGLQNAGLKAVEIQKELAALEEASHASPLKGKLSIVTVIRGAGTATGEYISIQASRQNKEKVLITGLKFQSVSSGNVVEIPKAVPLFFQNQLNVEEPIYLSPGETAYVITGRSPLGTSFRLNECTGFFNQFQTFNPSLPLRCPKPREEDLPPPPNIYNDACRDYINSLPSCRVIISPPASISPECKRYVSEEINYTKCVERRKNDGNFYDPTWQIYLGRDSALWKSRRELIHLVDLDGKVIDAITY